MKRNILNVLLVVIVALVSTGCPSSQTPTDRTEFETYRLFATGPIVTEYNTYKFLSDEQRPVYVGGDRGNNTNLKRVRAKDHIGNVQGVEYLVNGNNSYLDEQGEYAMGLLVRAPWGLSGSYTYRFELGDENFNTLYSTTATIEVISNRDYIIEYSCMGSAYDLNSAGYQFESSARRAYGAANTSFIRQSFNTNIPAENLDDISNVGLINWGDIYASGGVNHNPNIVVLFAVKDYTQSSSPPPYGRTAYGSSSQLPRKSYAYVFGKRIDDNLTGQDRQVAKTRVAIHELAHARGKDQIPNPLGDGDPHEGVGKGVCIMLQAPIYELEKNFRFCESHKQVLFNISW